jgi:uncharacterized protein YjbI with pentapeptide repeats
MPNQKHLVILRQGTQAWNSWYTENMEELAVLTGANLRCADLPGVSLTGADLRGADLRYANLKGADLRGAILDGANLDRADLRQAELTSAMGLTQDQLHNAMGDATTKLPTYVKRPAHWPAAAQSEGEQNAPFIWHHAITS